MQQKLEVEAVTQQQSLAVVKNMIRTSVRLLDNIDRKISEICYLRNLFDEDCFCKKNYAGIMINALHPMDTKEGSEPHIHNSEAWQLTRWLEEGVFGEFHSSLCPYTSRCSRKALSSRSGLRDLRPSRGQIPIPPNRNLFLYTLPSLPSVSPRRLHLPRHATHPAGSEAEQRAQSGEHRRREKPSRTPFLRVCS